MPWIENSEKAKKDYGWSDYYQEPHVHGDTSASDVDYALLRKKYYVQEREKMLELQKECGTQKDRDGARFFKEMAAENMKMYRGYCHVLAIIACNPPGDCKIGMTKELSPYADRAWGEIDLASIEYG